MGKKYDLCDTYSQLASGSQAVILTECNVLVSKSSEAVCITSPVAASMLKKGYREIVGELFGNECIS